MPTTVITSRIRPTYEERPDIRYATSFLDHKYRDYSVAGEAIMDKTTGELFMKRPIDGRIVSFEQNKKYLDDLTLEFRVLLNNNPEFIFPGESYSAYFLQTHYDLVTINDEHQADLYATCFEPTVIPNDEETPLHSLSFNLSNQTNGFFVRMNTRDSDKVIIEYLTNQYNKTIDNYAGLNPTILSEKDKMDAIDLWRDSNVQIDYTIFVEDAFVSKVYDKTSYVRYNEHCCLYLPLDQLAEDFPYGWNSVRVQINAISYPKLQFVLMHPTLFDTDFEEQVLKLIAPDHMIINQYLTVVSFVNTADDIDLLGNEQLVAMIDVPYLRRYMMKMGKLWDCSCAILSVERPGDDIWHTNGLWLEHVRDCTEGGREYWRGSETDIHRLETYLSKTHKMKYSGIFVEEESDTSNYFVQELSRREDPVPEPEEP